jgi:hypothetical protein
MNNRIDLRQIAVQLTREFPTIDSLWLFGSRRHRTLSVRSDIDILVVTSAYLKSSDVRRAIRWHCPALDLFLVDGGKAVSCINDSFVQAVSFDALREKLDAICIWSGNPDDVDNNAPFEQDLRSDIIYVPTVMDGGEPRIGNWGKAVSEYFQDVEARRLPTKPFVGETPSEVGMFLVDVCNRIVATCDTMATRKTKAAWKPMLKSEYDFQDAFFISVKPWLPDLAREETLLQFDDQAKNADFAVLEGRVVVEMKYVADANTKAAVVKTLDGLARFYTRNPRVEVLLFLVLATPTVDIDAPKWQVEFSSDAPSKKIMTRVFVTK